VASGHNVEWASALPEIIGDFTVSSEETVSPEPEPAPEPVIELAPDEPELPPAECPVAQSEPLVRANGHTHADGQRRAGGSVAAARGAALVAKLDEAELPMRAQRFLLAKLARADWPRSTLIAESGLPAAVIDSVAAQLGVKTIEGRWRLPG